MREAGEQNHMLRQGDAAHGVRELDAAHSRHAVVGDHEIKVFAHHPLERLAAVGRNHDTVAITFQILRDDSWKRISSRLRMRIWISAESNGFEMMSVAPTARAQRLCRGSGLPVSTRIGRHVSRER